MELKPCNVIFHREIEWELGKELHFQKKMFHIQRSFEQK